MARENASHFDRSADELFAPKRREAIEPGPLAFVGQFPGGGDPAFGLQSMERRIQRPGLDLEQVFRGPLNVFGDRVAVGGSGKQRAEDEEVERALQQLNTGSAAPGALCSHSTIYCVDSLRQQHPCGCGYRSVPRSTISATEK